MKYNLLYTKNGGKAHRATTVKLSLQEVGAQRGCHAQNSTAVEISIC
jgi:hypothetical protein